MKYFLIKLSLLILGSTNLLAQTFTIYSDKTFGTSERDHKCRIEYIGNHQFLLCGISDGDVDSDKSDSLCNDLSLIFTSDAWALKIDSGFNIIWDYSIGGNRWENHPSPMVVLQNGSFVTVMESTSNISCEKSENNRGFQAPTGLLEDYWICFFDSSGSLLWDKTYGGTKQDLLPQIIQLPNGNFIVCGSSESDSTADKTCNSLGDYDYWVLKLDQNGNKLWDLPFGGNDQDNLAFSLINDDNNNFILAGSTISDVSSTISDSCKGNFDFWLAKINENGVVVFDKRYGGSDVDLVYHTIKTSNGYMLCGTTNSPQGLDVTETSLGSQDVWIIKVDASGNKIWDKRYGGSSYDIGRWIQSTPDGGFIISASTNSDTSIFISENSYGGQDYWIFKIDSLGNKIWDKRFGGPSIDEVSNFIIMPDSSIYLFGSAYTGTSAVKTDSGKGDKDYWLIHFRVDETTGIEEINNQTFNLYPNPSSGEINLPREFIGYNLEVYDLTGRLVYKIPSLQATIIDLAFLSSGCFVINIIQEEKVYRARLILQ
jgi:hypothetical protein